MSVTLTDVRLSTRCGSLRPSPHGAGACATDTLSPGGCAHPERACNNPPVASLVVSDQILRDGGDRIATEPFELKRVDRDRGAGQVGEDRFALVDPVWANGLVRGRQEGTASRLCRDRVGDIGRTRWCLVAVATHHPAEDQSAPRIQHRDRCHSPAHGDRCSMNGAQGCTMLLEVIRDALVTDAAPLGAGGEPCLNCGLREYQVERSGF